MRRSPFRCTLALTEGPKSGNPGLQFTMIKAIDFCCGAGGLTRGLLDAGIDVLAGVDIDCRLRDTYERNNSPARFVCQDIRRVRINFILVENVPGLNTAYGKRVFDRFVTALDGCGFRNRYSGFLDAKDFGVPQVRKRFILLASRNGEIVPPRRSRRVATVREYIAKYPPLVDGEACGAIENHIARQLPPHLKRIVCAVPRDGGSRRDVADKELLLKCHRERPDTHKDVFGRMAWDRPGPTLTGRCTDVYCGRFTHPDQDRGLSLREAAALQTFRDDYVFYGTFFHIAHQIGNAVPVKLGARLGLAIKRAALREGILR
ncbi:MAG: DNA cytosine methyltransferase [Acidobacteriia bacterium]|nr:DNA cytosine methyltransferase [Terriglobia bacterium]